MDANIQRSLNDKLYDKRKVGALEYVLLPCFCAPRFHLITATEQRDGTAVLREA